jgi:membrane protein implicated in regulation of membrane protease activity
MDTVFLACFAFGALFTVASLALGAVGGLHFGHLHLGGHTPAGHAHVGTTPLLNGSSILGAITWFGAGGYLLSRLGGVSIEGILIGAFAAAAVGWYLIARFLGIVLKGEREMDPEDYRLDGTVARVTVRIPAGGTGEIVFTKAEARRSEAARAVGGIPIRRGTEVVITAYADGFAIVQPWGDFVAEHETRRSALAPAPNRKA